MKKLLLLLLAVSFSLTAQEKIKLKRNGNLHEIHVEINNTVKLPFLFDTGASEICIPPSVARVLILNNTLSVKDTLQGRYYTFANGQYAYHRRFMIRKLRIGNVVLRNVTCSVGTTESTALLFGQSALRQFKHYKVDNKTNTLYIWRK